MSNVKSIVKGFLRLYDYDGLYSYGGDCACELDDLMACGDTYHDCEAGVKIPCDPESCVADGDCYWHIGRKP